MHIVNLHLHMHIVNPHLRMHIVNLHLHLHMHMHRAGPGPKGPGPWAQGRGAPLASPPAQPSATAVANHRFLIISKSEPYRHTRIY